MHSQQNSGQSHLGGQSWALFLEPREKSQSTGRCAKFHVPSEKQPNTSAFLVVDICWKAHILSHKWENSKGGLEKSTFCQGFQVLSGVIGTFSTPSTRVPRRQAISLKGFVTLARLRRSLGKGATLENEFSDFSVFLCVLFCNGTSNMPSLNFFWHLRCFFAFRFFKSNHCKCMEISISAFLGCTVHRQMANSGAFEAPGSHPNKHQN